jgi:hypothetical protein
MHEVCLEGGEYGHSHYFRTTLSAEIDASLSEYAKLEPVNCSDFSWDRRSAQKRLVNYKYCNLIGPELMNLNVF